MKIVPFFSLLLILCCCEQADNTKGTIINVKGFSSIAVPPDVAEISMVVSSESISKDSAFFLVNTTINGLLDNLKLTAVKTNSINTGNYDTYFQKEKKSKIIYYHGSQSLTLKMNLSLLEIEKVVEVAKKFKRVDFNMSYDLSQKKQDSVELILTSLALKDAERKAIYISESSGMAIERIINISYHSEGLNSYRNPVEYEMFDESGNSYTGNIKLLPVPIELTDNIELSYYVRTKK